MQDSPPASPGIPLRPSSDFGRTAIVVLAALAVYLFNAHKMVLMDPDESRCALIAQQMIRTGDWLVPSSPLIGEAYFDKPILYFWLLAAAFKTLGVNEFAARLVSAIGAALLVGTVDRLGRLMFNPRAGLFASILLASSVMMLIVGRFVRMDIWFVLFITLAIHCWCGWHMGGRSRLYLLGAYLSIAAAVLTKGLAGILLPAGTIGCYLIVRRERRWDVVRRSQLMPGLLLVLLTAGLWYGWMEVQYPGYLRFFIYEHHILRVTTDRFGRSETVAFLPGVLLAGLLPWTAVFVSAIVRSLPLSVNAPWVPRPGRRVCIWWLVLGIVPLLLSRTQLPIYVLPAFPAAALLGGCHLDILLTRRPAGDRELRGIVLATAILMVLCVVTLAVINRLTVDFHPWWWLARRLPFVIGGLAVVFYLVRTGRLLMGLGMCLLLMIAGAADFVRLEAPELAERFSTASLGRRVRAEARDEDCLLIGPAPAFGAVLYSGAPLPIRYVDHIVDFLAFSDHPRPLLGLFTSLLLLDLTRERLGPRIQILAQDREYSLVRVTPRSAASSHTSPASREKDD